MHPKNISISEFSYTLPEEKIASYPLSERDASKLLIYKEGEITEDIYKNIPDHICSCTDRRSTSEIKGKPEQPSCCI